MSIDGEMAADAAEVFAGSGGGIGFRGGTLRALVSVPGTLAEPVPGGFVCTAQVAISGSGRTVISGSTTIALSGSNYLEAAPFVALVAETADDWWQPPGRALGDGRTLVLDADPLPDWPPV